MAFSASYRSITLAALIGIIGVIPRVPLRCRIQIENG